MGVAGGPSLARDMAGRYETWVARTGLAPATRGVYRDRVAAFLEWLDERGPAYEDALTDPDVRDYAVGEYRRDLLVSRKLAAATVAQHMAALGSFYEWAGLGKPEGVAVEVTRAPKLGLYEDERRKVMLEARRRGARDYALLSVLLRAGLRLQTVADLDVDDVHLTERTGTLFVRFGKGGKPQTIPVSSHLREALRPWLAERAGVAAEGETALFVGRTGARLKRRRIQQVVTEVGAAAGVELNPHKFRHTFVKTMLDAGVDIVTVAELAGHKSLHTTRGYATPRASDLRDAVERIG